MSPTRRILPAALAVLVAATAFAAEGSVPPGYETRSSRALAAGVEYQALTLADPPQSVHVARVAPGAARLAVVSSHDAVAHQDFGAELPAAMCRRVACLAGINADFGDGSGAPVGGVVSGGRLLRSPVPGRPQLNVTGDGRLQAVSLEWSASVSGHGRTVAVGGVNVARRADDVILYTPAWGGDTPPGADIELLLGSTGEIGRIGAATSLEVTGVRSGRGRIPAGGAILAARGPASATLQEFADKARSGTLQLRIQTALDVVESVGGHPVLLRSGQPAFPDSDDSFTRGRHPRSLVGWNPAGEVMLVTVDGGQGGASGMTLGEAAAFLGGLGATDGFAFDHSSATFVAGGAVQNRPVDDLGPGAPEPVEGREVAPGHWERPALNTLMALPKPAAPPPPGPAPTPAPGPGSGSGTGARPGGFTTVTTSAPGLSGARFTPKPGVVAVGMPAASNRTSVLPDNVGAILRNPTTKRSRRTAKTPRVKGDGGISSEESVVSPSIPDWDDITAALTPETVAGAPQEEGLALAATDGEAPSRAVGPLLLQFLAAGMIATVLWGLQWARRESRPRPILWL